MCDHDVAHIYNQLPTIEEADRRFADRDAILSQLAPLMRKYDNQFGVCLVHAHCKIEPGEKMVSIGNISEPLRGVECYPESWLSNANAYEFSTKPTSIPPPELFGDFQKIIGDVGILGLYYAGGMTGGMTLEWTEGRRNITKGITRTEAEGHIQTAWIPGSDPLLMKSCEAAQVCDSTTTRSGTTHKGTTTAVHYETGKVSIFPLIFGCLAEVSSPQ
jgi:hypothetical protein